MFDIRFLLRAIWSTSISRLILFPPLSALQRILYIAWLNADHKLKGLATRAGSVGKMVLLETSKDGMIY